MFTAKISAALGAAYSSCFTPTLAPATVEPETIDTSDCYEWAHRNRRIKNRPFTLKNFKPLEELYRDQHPEIVVIKPSQTGVSEWAVNRAFWALRNGAHAWKLDQDGVNVAYCFPTKTALSDFTKQRINGLRHETQYMADMFKGAGFDDLGFKQFGPSYLLLRGSTSVDATLSFPCDYLCLDEFDRMVPAAVELLEKRLRQSQAKRRVDLSTPSFPGKGIHARYLESDQRIWETRCEGCNKYHHLDFFLHVRADSEDVLGAHYSVFKKWGRERIAKARWYVECPGCKSEIDRCGEGRWRALKPEVESIRGYHIPALAFPAIELWKLATKAANPDPTVQTEFYRSDLGLPYEPAGSRLTQAMIHRLSSELENGHLPEMLWTRTTMGVDVGAVFNYKITATGADGRRYTLKMGTCGSYDDLSQLMREFHVWLCVIDALPETHGTKTWADQWEGRVYRAYYPSNDNALRGKMWRTADGTEEDPDDKKQASTIAARIMALKQNDRNVVYIERTMAMDAVYTLLAAGGEIWPEEISHDPEIIAQLIEPIRTKILNKRNDEMVVWIHTKPDHYYHAAVYCHIAEKLMPNVTLDINSIGATGSVKGWSAPA